MKPEAKRNPALDISTGDLARLFDRSPRWVNKLREAGWIAPISHGRYDLIASCRGVFAYHEDRAERANADPRAAVTDARTREIEQRIDMRAAGLCNRNDVAEVLGDLAAIAEDAMNGFTDRLGLKGASERQAVDQAVAGALNAIRRQRDKGIKTLHDGSPAGAP